MESRKVVTVVFSDVAGSTSLGERLDAESLSRVMARWFEAMRAVRAAAELRGGLEKLNRGLGRDWGVTLEIHTGVNTARWWPATPAWATPWC